MVVFTIVLLIILLAPLLLERLRIPGIVGMIVAGVIFGPHGLNWLENNAAFRLFGTVGLLYLMFMAGLEMDMNQFRQSRLRSLSFGLLTFVIPLGIGLPVCYYFLEYDFLPALLIASMFSTHTLIAYPIVQKLGLTRNEAVIIAIGGTIITDVLVLTLLAVISTLARGESDLMHWVKFVGLFALSSLVVLAIFPLVARWFFRRIEGEKISHYIFVLTLVFIAAYLFEVSGVEPIIGAFLAGLALNRLIPNSSPLMNRIEFVGNALFIPFFLISVGMLIDVEVIFSGHKAIYIALTLTVVALVSKWLASLAAEKVLGLSRLQGQLIFGLSSSHAAATIAVVLVGFRLGIVGENALNGTILLILITCLVSSFTTARAARSLALKGPVQEASSYNGSEERILVPISNPATIETLIDFALMIKTPGSKEPVIPFSVVRDDEEASRRMAESRDILEKAQRYASGSDNVVKVVTRIDVNTSSAISRASKELRVTDIVIGWHAKKKAADRIFGTTLDLLLKQTAQNIFVCRFVAPLNVYQRIVVFLPENIARETGFEDVSAKILRVAKSLGVTLSAAGNGAAVRQFVTFARSRKERQGLKLIDAGDQKIFMDQIAPGDMIFILAGRRGSLSYRGELDTLPEKLTGRFPQINVVIIYPAH